MKNPNGLILKVFPFIQKKRREKKQFAVVSIRFLCDTIQWVIIINAVK